jgi:hypothetical protein
MIIMFMGLGFLSSLNDIAAWLKSWLQANLLKKREKKVVGAWK